MKVFISSVTTGYGAFRDAAEQAITTLGHIPLRAERFPASVATPQQACLQGVREADIVVLLLGQRYGTAQASGLSPTHEEYREAKDRRPVLSFVQANVEPEHSEFWAEVRDWAGGRFIAEFATPEELRDRVTRSLHDFELASASGRFDAAEAEQRARSLLPQNTAGIGARLVLAVAGGPRQQVLRPAALEDPALARDLQREGLLGELAMLDPRQATTPEVRGDALWLTQRDARLVVDSLGSVMVEVPARSREDDRRLSLPAILEEDAKDHLAKAMRLAGWVLDHIDAAGRVTEVVPIAAVIEGRGTMWRTRTEHERSPNAGQLPMRVPDPAVATLIPPAHRRAALTFKADELAEDFVVLLRRQFRA